MKQDTFQPYKTVCPVDGKEVVWLPEKEKSDFLFLIFFASYTGPKVTYRCSLSGSRTCEDCKKYKKTRETL